MAVMNEIGIYLNCDKRNSIEMATRCVAYLSTQNVKVVMLSKQLQETGISGVTGYLKDEFFSKPQCIVTLGGDGTLLGAARHASTNGVPLCGINLGKLGFLTEGEAEDLEPVLERLCAGQFTLEPRMMLQCRITFANGLVEEHVALNDVLVKNAGFRMMELRAFIDDEEVDAFRADGLIIASPTGSTAYSLAAGGPVVVPGTQVMLLNPICPHRLHDRAYVVYHKSTIRLEFNQSARDLVVCADGQISVPIGGRDRVEVTTTKRSANLIRISDIGFFDRLRRKLSNDSQVFTGEKR
ncbi:NAD(+)/NADH kinase [Eubacterium aggregans]|uniref:NAD(+)/NADH kinase n=1 Tax=Eubacterium aggregans TaxID=81409 RepID=UPI003F3A8903